jgi:exportin-5
MAAAVLNGASPAGPAIGGGDLDNISKIREALQLIYDPLSTNQVRKEANGFLESVKAAGQAPSIGYELASDAANAPIVRHYGLSLLEHSIRHKWTSYSDEEAAVLRSWVFKLAGNVSRDDAPFLRNKIALLWVEVAKRCWAAEWMDMDDMLLQLWQIPGPTVHKELVLYILETLSDEVFSGDDAVVAVREGVLSKACVEIFTPAAVLARAFPNRQTGPEVRSGEDGWLNRVAALLRDCLNEDAAKDDHVRHCAVRSLAVLYTLMSWTIPKAIVASDCVPAMCRGLASSQVSVQKVHS